MKCVDCEAPINKEDNFCWHCGHWTAKGYTFLKDQDNIKMIEKGEALKLNNRFALLISLLAFAIVGFAVMMFIRQENLFRPIAYIQKQINTYRYGYQASLIKTDNKYDKVNINSYDEAITFLKKDFTKQAFLCNKNDELYKIEYDLETNYNIPSVLLCDISYEEGLKIKEVIDRMVYLFPTVSGGLTNITITNAKEASSYIAYFQPMYQFVNINQDINKFNKVNKTQILLNSYYFLNEDMLAKPLASVVGENWYVQDANWETTIAHELGHFLLFKAYLKENNLENVTFITKDNNRQLENLLQEYEKGDYALNVVNQALTSYNNSMGSNIDIASFAGMISSYAALKDIQGNLQAEETIAEAIHDYYLHQENASLESLEIVKIVKQKLGMI